MRKDPVHVKFVHSETLSASRQGSLPEWQKMTKRQIVIESFLRIADEEESKTVLFFEVPHELDLVRMNILQGECLLMAFFGIKAEEAAKLYNSLLDLYFGKDDPIIKDKIS